MVKWKGDKQLNRRTCTGCGGRSYSSYNGPNWHCPYCGRNLSHVSNEQSDTPGDSLKKETFPVKFLAIMGGKSERYVANSR